MISVQSKTARQDEQPQMVQQVSTGAPNGGTGGNGSSGRKRTKASGGSNKRQKAACNGLANNSDPLNVCLSTGNQEHQAAPTVQSQQYQPVEQKHQQQAQIGPQREDSVWIIGLMNNIEHLLATFNSINNQTKLAQQQRASASSASTSLASSGYSTPSTLNSPPFVASTVQTSSSSSYLSSHSSATNSPNGSPNGSPASNYTSASSSSSSNSSSSSSLSSSSSVGGQTTGTSSLLNSTNQQHHHHHHHHHHQQQQVASRGALGISRQIKFHEYKGPPQPKRPPASSVAKQQTQPQPMSQTIKQEPTRVSSSNCGAEHSASLDQVAASGRGEMQPTRPISGAKVATIVQSKCLVFSDDGSNNNNNIINNNNNRPIRQQTMTSGQPMVIIKQQPVVVLGNQNLQSAATNVGLMKQHQQQQQQPDHRHESLQIVQTGPGLYAPNDCLHSPSRNGITNVSTQNGRLSVSFPSGQQVLVGCQGLNQQQQTQRWPDTNHEMSAQMMGISNKNGVYQQPNNNMNYGMNKANLMPRLSAATTTVSNGQTYSSNSSSLSSPFTGDDQLNNNCQSIDNPISEEYQLQLNQQQEKEDQEQQQQQQQYSNSAPSDFGSFLANVSNDSAGEDDTCDIEPTICFSGQQFDENLLFSEFIDLQDVPLNVDESDWLKKFLPPCSMGS